MKICPECSQIVDEDQTTCSWCGHALTGQNVFVLQRKIRTLHDPIGPRCRSCGSRSMTFVANEYKKLPVRATYRCPACQNTLQTSNYLLTGIYAFARVLRSILENFHGGGG